MAVNIKLKHSSVDSKAPVAADLENGEVALNINANSPAAYIKDSNGDIVKLAGAGSVTDETNVKKAGDNMTGDLTLGTDKITLDATAGSITAAGIITSDTRLITGGNPNGGTADGCRFDSIGAAKFSRTNGASAVIEAYTTGDSQLKAGINADGSATFAGDILSTSTGPSFLAAISSTVTTADNYAYLTRGQVVVQRQDGANCFVGSQAGTITSQIGADGSATFASNVDVGDSVDSSADWTGAGATIYSAGVIYAGRSGVGNVFVGRQSGTSTNTSSISADGSAEFVGNVNVGDYNAAEGVQINAQGCYFANRSDAAETLYVGQQNATVTSQIFADGTASFAGSVSCGQVAATYVTVTSAAGSGSRPAYFDSSGGLSVSSSDRNLKTGITTLSSQVDAVKALNPVSFNWIDSERFGAGLEIGFIAQEVEEVIPEVVRSSNDGILSVDYAKLTATLTSALQTALTRIETLETEVQALKAIKATKK